MMTLEQSTALYAQVLRQLLPVGGYDTSPKTLIAKDINAHAKALAQADLDAKRLLNTLSSIPPELMNEYETEYGLPLQCMVNTPQSINERLALLKWVKETTNVLNKAYLQQLLQLFGLTLLDIQKYRPMQSTTPCNAPINTEQCRYKVKLKLNQTADLSCIAEHYLPAYIKLELEN